MSWNERLLQVLKKIAFKILFSEETKDRVVNSINDRIDIPFLGEEYEKEIAEIMYDAIRDIMKEELDNIIR